MSPGKRRCNDWISVYSTGQPMMKRLCSRGSFSASALRCSWCTARLERSIDVRLVMAAMALIAVGFTDCSGPTSRASSPFHTSWLRSSSLSNFSCLSVSSCPSEMSVQLLMLRLVSCVRLDTTHRYGDHNCSLVGARHSFCRHDSFVSCCSPSSVTGVHRRSRNVTAPSRSRQRESSESSIVKFLYRSRLMRLVSAGMSTPSESPLTPAHSRSASDSSCVSVDSCATPASVSSSWSKCSSRSDVMRAR
mmetsp:Transcript_17756/g.53237  ORF Transcript_17756/g.53237 Transcript_17756/m.53237 type:complete len:248 (-) Transcript_17756:211-954(-)